MLRLYVKKINRTYEVAPFADLPQASQEYLIQYGVDQSGTDSHASITRGGSKPFQGTDAEFDAAVDKEVTEWVAKIRSGQLRARVTEDPAVVAVRFLKSQGYTEAQIEAMLAGAPAKKAKKAA